jgi:hypothetical protein
MMLAPSDGSGVRAPFRRLARWPGAWAPCSGLARRPGRPTRKGEQSTYPSRLLTWRVAAERLSTSLGLVLVFGKRLIGCAHGSEHTFDLAADQPDSQRVSRPIDRQSAERPDGLADEPAALTSVIDQLANRDLTGLPGATLAARVLRLRRLVDRLEGHWLQELAAVDARGAAGVDQGIQAPSTAGWLRNRLHMGAGAASGAVRTDRAVFRGPLTATGQALTDGAISPAHARVLAAGTQDLPAPTAAEAERCCWRPPDAWWPTPRAPTAKRSGATSGGACG